MVKQLRFSEAKRILDTHCIHETGKPASSRKHTKERNFEGQDDNWWRENLDTVESWDGNRSKAYLCAYLEIAGPRFFVTGIPLADGYLQPDRAVMKRLLKSGAVVIEDNRFELTDSGRGMLGSENQGDSSE